MSPANAPIQVTIVGGGMITHDQILPSIYHLQRQGLVGPIRICAINSPPLKALAVDVRRNLLAPVEEMGLDIRVETRTGDTPSERKARQRARPPQILLTTPESIESMLVSTMVRSRIGPTPVRSNTVRTLLISVSMVIGMQMRK